MAHPPENLLTGLSAQKNAEFSPATFEDACLSGGNNKNSSRIGESSKEG
jgi:hypothetical protein